MNKLSLILVSLICLCFAGCSKPTVIVTHVESYGYTIEDGMPHLTLSKPLDQIDFTELTIVELLADEYYDDVSEAKWIKERIGEENYEAVLVRG